MKTRNLIKTTALSIIALTVISLSSCLKDPRYVDYGSATPFVELPLAASGGAFQPEAYTISATPVSLPLVVNYAASKPASSAITVTLKVDAAALAAYNTANSTNYTILPTADYSIANLSVTIPAGQNTAVLPITINISQVDPNGQFILPISIASAGGIAISSSSTILYNVQAKNAYDGVWTVNGTMNDLGSTSITGKYPVNYYLETQGASTDAMYDVNYAGTFGHEILSGTSTSYYGSFGPVFTFGGSGASTTITSVVNYYGQPAGNGRSAGIDPTGQNKFISGTPGTVGAKFQVSYFMYQPSVIPVGPRVFFNETWTYVGSR